jgi:hypothetical protein
MDAWPAGLLLISTKHHDEASEGVSQDNVRLIALCVVKAVFGGPKLTLSSAAAAVQVYAPC